MNKALPTKAFELSIDVRPDYLYIVVECDEYEYGLDVAHAYLQEIADIAREMDAPRVLLERRICQTLSNVESHLALSAFSDIAPHGLRIAIVDPEEKNRRRLSFAARTAEPIYIKVQVFEGLSEAESWLME